MTEAGDHELKTTLVYIARSTGENENPKHCFRLFNALWLNHLEQIPAPVAARVALNASGSSTLYKTKKTQGTVSIYEI